ncbi:MAG: type II toxin-antitoxin system RelE/ParE family toxin [Candidatus Gracilibacteria bacterium]
MYKIFYSPKSTENLQEIFSYISKDNSFYAAKVITSIKNTIDILKIFPISGNKIGNINRFIVNSYYKYKIVYKVNKMGVFVVSISKYRDF